MHTTAAAFGRLHLYLSVLRALGVVSGVEHLEATHVTHVTVKIGTVDSVAAFSNSSVWAELLPQLFVVQCCVTVKLLNDRDRVLHFHRLSCTSMIY